ncbi:protein RGF1 INDUCIBLE TRANSCRIPTION FACTOR 1-like [Gastrolobium bilobum]|uniref:protein RGF1 INDUCIBLE TRANSCRIPTION FACTOR 1-like n=1 Tax=Gastrolobium bilobum TaxID=150636 RepID=UPI002AAF8C61|nr:protein RGF1 INDUCIBLE TRANSCRIPTION FACTOR 1-like [Gastrolobium bilobum]XP_061340326.1 protein RGF1 INDUCIBLE TRANSCRIPTION FACTOR 1-like [Gastrolobium bilobum]
MCFSSKCISILSWDEQVDKAYQPKWLEDFLSKAFFDPCTAHPSCRNELNKYCINCSVSVCQYCASSSTHCQHKMLKIYRHLFTDVVALAAMEKHFDCSQIQPYKCNKRLVIALKPLPHCGSAKRNEACNICGRKLAEPDLYDYCSISCKVKAVLSKLNDSVPASISTLSLHQENKEETTEPSKWVNKRKRTTPRRAPFF